MIFYTVRILKGEKPGDMGRVTLRAKAGLSHFRLAAEIGIVCGLFSNQPYSAELMEKWR